MSVSTTLSPPRHTHADTIAATPPFAFAQALRFLDGFTPTHGEQAIAPDILTKAVFVAGRPLLFQVRSSGTTDAPALAYTLHADDPLDARLAQAASERIAFFLGVADDLRPFYAIGRADADFAPLIERLYGYHQVTFLTPFENACWAVLSQRTPLAQARHVKEELTRRYGATLALDGVAYPAFPEADRLAAADPAAVLAIVRNERRAFYLRAVAAAFVDADETWLRTAPYDEVEGWLRDQGYRRVVSHLHHAARPRAHGATPRR